MTEQKNNTYNTAEEDFITARCPVCKRTRRLPFQTAYLKDPAIAEIRMNEWPVVCEDCMSIVRRFCDDNGIDPLLRARIVRGLKGKKDVVVVNILSSYREKIGMEITE